MSIPKTIYQTYKSEKLPLLTQWHIYQMKKKNADYQYEFYTDDRIDSFIKEEYGTEIVNLYRRINIGACKADFFRYAVLFAKGGIYLDIDSQLKNPLDSFINPDDVAIITNEKHPQFYVQWALFYAAKHPFLEKTFQMAIHNLTNNTFPNDVHQMTGPSVYSLAINEVLKKNPTTPHRLLGIDYDGNLKFSYPFSKFFLYNKNEHWKQKQLTTPVLKDKM